MMDFDIHHLFQALTGICKVKFIIFVSPISVKYFFLEMEVKFFGSRHVYLHILLKKYNIEIPISVL